MCDYYIVDGQDPEQLTAESVEEADANATVLTAKLIVMHVKAGNIRSEVS